MPTTALNSRLNGWTIVKLVLGIDLLLYVLFLSALGFTEDGIRACIAWSAKISFSLFCLAFSASALHHLFNKSFTSWLVTNRKFLGVGFAVTHLIHLLFLLILQQVFILFLPWQLPFRWSQEGSLISSC